MNKFYDKYIDLKYEDGITQPFPATVFQTLKQIYMLDLWRWNILLSVAVIAAMIEPAIMWLLGHFLDLITNNNVAPSDVLIHPYFITILILFAVVLPLFDTIEIFIQNILVNTKLGQRTRLRAMNYLTRQTIDFFANEMAGRLSAKAFDLGRASSDLMITVFTQTCFVLVFFATTSFLGGVAHWLLAVLMIIWGFSSGYIIYFFTPILAHKSSFLTESYSTAFGRSVDILSNISITKLFSKPEDENIGFLELLNKHTFNAYNKNMSVSIAVSSIYIWNGICVASLLFASAWLWSKDEISTGMIATFIPLVLRMRPMIDWIFMQASMISENYGTVQTGIEVLQRPITIIDKPNAPEMPRANGLIEFKNVNFVYGSGRTVFENLNLTIPSGQKVGLVGPSGAGKTTLLNLILRFYDIQSGEIKIDGYNIADITQNSLRANIGMVTQDPSLLNRSILDNIRYGSPNKSIKEIENATRKAAAHDFILLLKDKNGRSSYNAQVGERGVKLSGGQRQRIAIARLILKNAPIMLLDEATSALDSESESVVQEQIYPLMQDRTVIAIAHRLSTVMRMDRLLVLDQGRIVEDGTHDELLKHNGLYAKLWERQSSGFLPEK